MAAFAGAAVVAVSTSVAEEATKSTSFLAADEGAVAAGASAADAPSLSATEAAASDADLLQHAPAHAKKQLSAADVDSAEEAERWGWIFYGRWGVWFVIAYMFYAQASICDEYFLASINVMVEKYKIPEATAGATLMALGCNGPELFSNAISIFAYGGSDVGVGTIVGSEIFNLLVICGGAAIVTPGGQLFLDQITFNRDAFMYLLSIAGLAWTLADGQVTATESAVLVLGCIVFAVAVTLTPMVLSFWEGKHKAELAGFSDDLRESLIHDGGAVGVASGFLSSSMSGGTFTIQVSRHNRLADAAREPRSENVTVEVSSKGICITGIAAMIPGALAASVDGRAALAASIALGHDASGGQNLMTSYLSLTRAPIKSASMKNLLSPHSPTDDSLVPFSDIRAIQPCPEDATRIVLRLAGQWGADLTAIVDAPNASEKKRLLKALDRNLQKAKMALPNLPTIEERLASVREVNASASHRSVLQLVAHFIAWPIDTALHATMSWCDVREESKKQRFLACFCMSMAWLAVFSYLMCGAAGLLHTYFHISTAILGYTVCAIGTSFPNFFASIVMAREGRSAMAVANALGSNVQNVFLALAVPWLLQTGVVDTSKPFPMPAPGLGEGIMWMLGTLLALWVAALLLGWRLTATTGWVLVAAYAVYLVTACLGI